MKQSSKPNVGLVDSSCKYFIAMLAGIILLSSSVHAESLGFYFDYVEKQGATLGHYYKQILPDYIKNEYPEYAQRFRAWQNKIPPAITLLGEFHGLLVKADRYCRKKPNKNRCRDAMAQTQITGERYTATSRALDQELSRVIEFGKSKGLR